MEGSHQRIIGNQLKMNGSSSNMTCSTPSFTAPFVSWFMLLFCVEAVQSSSIARSTHFNVHTTPFSNVSIISPTTSIPRYQRHASTVRCLSSAPFLDISQKLRLGYQFWGRRKQHRIMAKLDRNFIETALEPLDEMDFMFQLIEQLRSIKIEAEDTSGYNGSCLIELTQKFCNSLPRVLWSIIVIGAKSAFRRQDYADPFVLQNYFYYYMSFSTDITVAFKLRTQRNAVSFLFSAKIFALFLLPAFLIAIVVDVSVLRNMLKQRKSSALTYHIYLCFMDTTLYLCMICLAFPVGFLPATGAPCVALDANLVDLKAHPWPMDLPYRMEEASAFLKNVLLTLLIADRTSAVAMPVFYFNHCNKQLARKCCIAAVLLNTAIISLLFMNSWYLPCDLEQRHVFSLFVVARSILFLCLLVMLMLQFVLPQVFRLKTLLNFLKSRKNENTSNEKWNHSAQLFLFIFTFYNLLTVASLYGFLIGDTFWQLIVTGNCNRCMYFYHSLSRFGKFIMIIIGVLQPPSSAVGFVLHFIFLQQYRRECVKLLRLNKVPSLKSVLANSVFAKAKFIKGGGSGGGKESWFAHADIRARRLSLNSVGIMLPAFERRMSVTCAWPKTDGIVQNAFKTTAEPFDTQLETTKNYNSLQHGYYNEEPTKSKSKTLQRRVTFAL